MDAIDCKILSNLQRDGSVSMSVLSQHVGLSLSACHRRVKIMEKSGVIEGYTTRLNQLKLGFEINVFIEVKLLTQRSADIKAFEDAIATMPEILECHMISGDFDYLMRVAAKGAIDYQRLYRERLSTIPSVSQMKTMMGLSTVKRFNGFHLEP